MKYVNWCCDFLNGFLIVLRVFYFFSYLILSLNGFVFNSSVYGVDPFDFENGNQEDLNRWVARAGAEVYQKLNNDPMFDYPAGTKASDFYTKSDHWWVSANFLDSIVNLRKVPNVSASEALASLLTSEGRFDCRIAQRIVFSECMRALLGDTLFNLICESFETEPSQDVFSSLPTKLLSLCGGESLNPYFRLTSRINGFLYSEGKVGYFGYIPNIPEYAALHPTGQLRGDNCLLCSDDDLSILVNGYGGFYSQGGQPWDLVKLRFKDETLKEREITPQVPVADESAPTNSRQEWARRMKARLAASERERLQKMRESLQQGETYETKFEEEQRTFQSDAYVYYIDLEKVKQIRQKFAVQ